MRQKYTVSTSTTGPIGEDQFVWEGDLDELAEFWDEEVTIIDKTVLLHCQGGSLVNLANVVSLVPVG